MAGRAKMDRQERAKQFMPFAALKGYEEALREKEKIVVPRIELSEEMKEELDRNLQKVERNTMVKVVYFSQGEYLQITGMVSRMDRDAKILKVVGTKILFEDIYRLELVNGS